MTPKEILEGAQSEKFTWVDYYIEDGEEVPFDANEEWGTTTTLELLPGLSDDEVREFASSLPGPLPSDIEELLRFSSGFDLGSEMVRFTDFHVWGYDFLLPHVVVLNGDGAGNSWVIEVNRETGDWRHVWFECHDPPALMYQCETLAEYIDAVLDEHRFEKCVAGHRGILHGIDDLCYSAYRNHLLLPTAGSLKEFDDPVLREFAAGLSDRARIADFRDPKMGDGFDWSSLNYKGRQLARAGALLLFGIEPQPGLLTRLFGR